MRKHIGTAGLKWYVSGCVMAALLAGCQQSAPSDLFEHESPNEIGATHFAVTAVTPWAEVADQLQPRFDMDENRALQEVLPAVSKQSESQSDINQLRVGILTHDHPHDVEKPQGGGGAGGGAGGKGDGGKGGGAATGGDKGGDNATSKGDAKGSDTNPLEAFWGGGDSHKGHDKSDASITSNTWTAPPSVIEVEPQLKYTLATALIQHVRLTNRYVRDLVGREGCDGYVIRMQVGLMPVSRQSPYDTYVDIAFFSEHGDVKVAEGQGDLNTVKVVPLLATDSLEGLLHARSNNAMTDIGLNLQALFASGNAVGVDASKLSQTLKAVAGRDLNSLLTIGRVSDNVVRVRLGASAQPSGEYVMVPRTYTIPVVLLVPISANHQANNGQSERTIRAVSKTVFVNALTGRLRRSRTNWQAILKAAPVHGAYEIAKFPDDKVFQLTEYARRGEYAEFAKAVSADSGDKTMDTDHIGKLWLEAISLRAADAIQTASFTLPAMPEPTAPPDQAGIITDNGKVTFVTLLGGQALHRMNMLASLDVSTGDAKGAQPLRLYATEAALPSPDRDVVRFAFPSLAAAGLELAPGPVDAQQVSLRVQYHPMNGRIDAQAQQAAATDAGRKYPLLFLAQPAGSAGNDSGENPTGNGAAASTRPNLLSLDPASQAVQPSPDGTAVVAVRLRQPSHGGIYLRASGCEIAGVDPTDCLEHVNGKWALRRAGSARLRLSNFVAPEVQLELNDEHGTVIQQVVCQIRR